MNRRHPFHYLIAMLLLLQLPLIATAQTRNEIFTVKVNDLTYDATPSKPNAGEVVGTVLEALAGEATNKSNPLYAPAVSNMVRTAFSGVRRLAPIAEAQQAQYDISGDITSIVTHTSSRTVERKDTKGKPYKMLVNGYDASVAVTLTLTEKATGQQWTNSFSANTLWYEEPQSEQEAFEIVVGRLHDDIVKAYNVMFPLVAEIIEPGEAKKDKQKDGYIDLGEANGIYKGIHFDVFELSEIAGRESRKRLGKLKVEEVMGDDVARCKVEKGSKEIKCALDDAKQLLVTSID